MSAHAGAATDMPAASSARVSKGDGDLIVMGGQQRAGLPNANYTEIGRRRTPRAIPLWRAPPWRLAQSVSGFESGVSSRKPEREPPPPMAGAREESDRCDR